MKGLLPPLFVLLFLTALVLTNAAVLSTQSEYWCGEIRRAQSAAEGEDWDKAANVLEDLQRDWERRSFYLHIVIRHDELDEAESFLAEARAFGQEKNGAEFRASTSKLATQLRRLTEAEGFSLKNIL